MSLKVLILSHGGWQLFWLGDSISTFYILNFPTFLEKMWNILQDMQFKKINALLTGGKSWRFPGPPKLGSKGSQCSWIQYRSHKSNRIIKNCLLQFFSKYLPHPIHPRQRQQDKGPTSFRIPGVQGPHAKRRPLLWFIIREQRGPSIMPGIEEPQHRPPVADYGTTPRRNQTFRRLTVELMTQLSHYSDE